MERWWLAVVVGASLAATVVPDESVGACSIVCPSGSLTLELVEVRLIEAADPAAEAPAVPAWGATGELTEWGSMWFDDGSTFSLVDGEVAS